jgi:molybdate transport system substrate-binding protein
MQRMLQALCSMAPRAVLAQAASLYGKQCFTRIDVQAAGGVDVARRVKGGEAVDVVVLASDAIDKLIASGKLLAASRTPLMESEIAIAVRAGSIMPQVPDEPSLKALILQAPSLSYSTGPSGQYLEKLFERWGIHEQIRARIVVPSPGVPVATLIASGEVALGFQQLSELIGVPGVQVAAALPAEVQLVTAFTAGISPGCEHIDEAERFVRFAASGALDAVREQYGMGPPHQ